MDDLIEALTILKKYVEAGSYEDKYPTHCEHDELIMSVSPYFVSEEDMARLQQLGFEYDMEDEKIYSFRFGSN